MRYQKEFEYICKTIEKLLVTITNQSEALSILAEKNFDKDAPKAMEGVLLDVHNLWLLFFLYIPGSEVAIECAEPTVE